MECRGISLQDITMQQQLRGVVAVLGFNPFNFLFRIFFTEFFFIKNVLLKC
jgi:hypothetical protein